MNKSLIKRMKEERISRVSIDLFSGPGGLCTGFKWAGILPLIAVEWTDTTVETYSVTHNAEVFELSEYMKDGKADEKYLKKFLKESTRTILVHGDINLVTNEMIKSFLLNRYGIDCTNENCVDVVSGGAPCESFSLAGTRTAGDERDDLFSNIVRISRAVNTKMILFENVKGMFSKAKDGVKGAIFNYICDTFEDEKTTPSYRLTSRDQNTILLKACDDGVVPFGIAYQMIEHKGADLMGHFSGKARLGLHFEEKLVASLNSQDNLEIWQEGRTTKTGYLFDYFKLVMESTKISKEKVVSVHATSDITKLPSGGSPKTDVYLEIEMIDGTKSFTYSCKRSSKERVSVHEYTAEAFSRVLNPYDDELKFLLYEFQSAGGVRAMHEGRATRLATILNRYADALSKWVLGGIGGEGDPKMQWASHIITVSDEVDECTIHSINEYISLCKQQGVEGQLGTLFQWTYPSGGKGKRIQLKGKII